MAEFSVKSFTLSVYVKRVLEACSQVCYVTEVRLSHGSSSVMKTLTFSWWSFWPSHWLQTTTLTHTKQSCTGTTRSDRLFLVWVPRLWYAPASGARLLRENLIPNMVGKRFSLSSIISIRLWYDTGEPNNCTLCPLTCIISIIPDSTTISKLLLTCTCSKHQHN